MEEKTTLDLQSMTPKELCELYNEGKCKSEIIDEFRKRKISVVNIQRSVGSGSPIKIWYNEKGNRIEVSGRHFFEGTNLLQW